MKSWILSDLIMKAFFGLMALAIFGSVDFMMRRQSHGPGYGVVDWAGEVVSNIRVVIHPPKQATLKEMVPPAPEGWDVKVFARDDISRLTGVPVGEGRQYSMLEVASGAGLGSGAVDTEVRTYTSGDKTVLLRLTRLDDSAFTGLNTLAGEALTRMDAFTSLMQTDRVFFADVRGVWFYVEDRPSYGGGREIRGKIGKQTMVTVVSKDSDADILAVLEGLDVAGLNAMALEPVPGLGLSPVTQEPPAGVDPQVQAAMVKAGQVIGADVGGQRADPAPEAAAETDAAAVVPEAVETPVAAPEAEAPAVQAAGGSFLGRLFGSKAKVEAEAAPEPQPEQKVITCTSSQGFKRCTVGGG